MASRCGLTALAALLLLVPPAARAAGAAYPGFAQVKAAWVPTESLLLDRRGQPLAQVRTKAARQRLAWVGLADIAPAMRQALIASEDKRFEEHGGVDWQALAGAMWENLWRTRPRGASTLTMQLAGLLDPRLAIHGRARSLRQKWDQIEAAQEIERHWSKAEILEAYLNLVPFRGEFSGIHAASRGLFGKHPNALDRDESAILAALLRGPNAPPATVAARACGVLHTIQQSASCADLRRLALARLAAPLRPAPLPDLAPALARRLLTSPGVDVVTTLDADLQRAALAALGSGPGVASRGKAGGDALVLLDNASGDVLAWLGGDAAGPEASDSVLTPRPAGTALQPFLYELALEKRLLTAASLVQDAPLSLDPTSPLYLAEDEAGFQGLVSLRTALADTLEAPALRTLQRLGADGFLVRLRALGLVGADQAAAADDAGGDAALALGDTEVRLIDLANAYRTLADGGRVGPPRLLAADAAPPPRPLLAAPAVFIVGDILAGRSPAWSAVVAGSDGGESWCVGYGEQYTLALRLARPGDAEGVWRRLMAELTRERPSRPPPPPAGLSQVLVRFEPPLEPVRREWFINGTERAVIDAFGAEESSEPAGDGHGQ